LLAPIFGAALAATAVAPVRATNLNMGAVECQVAFGPADQISRQPYGVNTRSDTETPQSVVCSVPRSPLPAGSNGAFYVDGENYDGAFTTSCAISSFDSDGHLAAIATFTTSVAFYDIFVTLPGDAMPVLGHTTLSCVLPAHGNGYLRGVTSIQ
jgi:hypothetical protein